MKIKEIGDITQVRIHIRSLPLSVCFYELDGLLIDTGSPVNRKELLSYFRDKNYEQVVLTHHHEDHSGMAGWLEREKNLPIYMLPETKEILNQPYPIPFYRRVTWGQMGAVEGKIIGPLVETNQYRFRVIHTPGHCYDHLALLEPNRGLLFTGDLYVSSRIKYSLRKESLKAMLNSIHVILQQGFEHVFCAHAGYIKHGRLAFEKKKEYLENLVLTVLDYHKQGLEQKEIRAKLHPEIDWKHYFSRGEFSSHNVVRLILEEFADSGC